MQRVLSWSLISPFYLVSQNCSCVIERMGKFLKVVDSGLHFKIPFIDYIGYSYSLKEQFININSQSAITRDNVIIKINGVLCYQIKDPYKMSYKIVNPVEALTCMTQTNIRSEIGKIDLDTIFKERAQLNESIKQGLNSASKTWGINCMKYEIKDIQPPEEVKAAMELQAEYERRKRSMILSSEATMKAMINSAEGEKQAAIFKATGEALKIEQNARGQAESLMIISKALENPNTEYALKMKLCMDYLKAMTTILKNVNTVILPKGKDQELLNTIVAALTVYNKGVKESFNKGEKAIDDAALGNLNELIKKESDQKVAGESDLNSTDINHKQ